MRLQVASAFIICIGAGCKSKTDTAKGVSVSPIVTSASVSGAASTINDASSPDSTGTRPPRRVARSSDISRSEVDSLLDAWVADQNAGNFDSYAAHYSTAFQGVRRSGTKVVPLDYKSWLADRKRMFAKPMMVVAAEREVSLAGAKAHVRFAQDWSSASYHDLGAKIMDLNKVNGTLYIVSEQMLASKIMPSTASGSVLLPLPWLVADANLVIAAEAEGWKTPTLVNGRVPEIDDVCDEHPDYEEDQEDYWTCFNSKPENTEDQYAATAPIARLSAAIRKRFPLAINGYSATGTVCQATVNSFSAYGEWGTKASELLPDMAQAVLENRSVTMGNLPAHCKAAVFALPATAPIPTMWLIEPANALLTQLAGKTLDDIPGMPKLAPESHFPASKLTVWRIAPPASARKGRVLILAMRTGELDCHSSGATYALFELRGSDKAPTLVELASDPAEPADLKAAPDLDGDGHPELVLAHATLRWNKNFEGYELWPLLDFPDERDTCYCECE